MQNSSFDSSFDSEYLAKLRPLCNPSEKLNLVRRIESPFQ